jgi:hypothetical protein
VHTQHHKEKNMEENQIPPLTGNKRIMDEMKKLKQV